MDERGCPGTTLNIDMKKLMTFFFFPELRAGMSKNIFFYKYAKYFEKDTRDQIVHTWGSKPHL